MMRTLVVDGGCAGIRDRNERRIWSNALCTLGVADGSPWHACGIRESPRGPVFVSVLRLQEGSHVLIVLCPQRVEWPGCGESWRSAIRRGGSVRRVS